MRVALKLEMYYDPLIYTLFASQRCIEQIPEYSYYAFEAARISRMVVLPILHVNIWYRARLVMRRENEVIP